MNFNDIDLDEQNRLLNVAKSAEDEFSSDQDKIVVSLYKNTAIGEDQESK